MNVQTIVLAGGEGTRLRPLTEGLPKPLVPLLDEPVAGYVLQLLRRHGVREATMTLRCGAEQVKAAFDSGSGYSVVLSYAEEDMPLGTAGSVKAAAVGERTLLVISGDILTDCDLSTMYASHRASGALATIALAEVEDTARYGLCKMDEGGYIRRFIEKPGQDAPRHGWVNAGIYFLEPQVLKRIPPDTFWDFGRDVFPRMAAEGLLHGFPLSGYWQDIGTLAGYAQGQTDLLMGRVGLAVRGRRVGRAMIGKGAQVDARAKITGRCFIGEHASVGPGVTLGEGAVLCRGVCVNGSVRVEHACLWPDAHVEGVAALRHVVILPRHGHCELERIAPYPAAEKPIEAKTTMKKEG